MKRFFTKHKNTLFVSALTLLSFLLGMFLLGQKDLSLDEIATALIVQDWNRMLHIVTFTENNMWLYYLLLHFWQAFGTSEFALRSLSVIFATLSIPVIYLLGRKVFSNKVALLAILLIVVNVFFISNAQNARAYALVLLLTTLSSYFFVQFVNGFSETKKISKKYLFLLVLCNVLSVYAHLYALFVIASQAVSLLFIHKKQVIKSLLISLPITGVFLLPLFLAPSLSGQPTNWIPVPGIRNLIGTYLILSDDFPPIGLIYLALFAGFFMLSFSKKSMKHVFDTSNWQRKYMIIWALLPIVLSFLFSLFIKPLYISMYFFICLVPFMLVIAYLIDKIRLSWVKLSLVVLLLLLSSIRLYGWYSASSDLHLVISNNTEDWKGVATFLTTQTRSTDAILFFPPFVQENVDYYINKDHMPLDTNREINLQPDIYAGGTGYEQFDSKKLQSIPVHYSRLWYISGMYTDNAISDQEKQINTMLKNNYTLARTVPFYAITAYLYVRK